jgi:hypothetical protein
MMSINKQDFTHRNYQGTSEGKLDPQFLRASHFQLGDKSQNPTDQWATTYNSAMAPREVDKDRKKDNPSFKSSVVINPVGGDGIYQTETRSK